MERRLLKSRTEKMIAGVAGGLAEYFDIDPVLARIGFVVLAFLHGVGVVAYIILWIVMPTAKAVPAAAMAGAATEGLDGDAASTDAAAPMAPTEPMARKRNGHGSLVAGAVLIGLGVIFLLDNLIPAIDFGALWPLVLILLGGGLLWNSITRES